MKPLVWSLVVLLILLHQDFWFWEDDTLVFRFLPIGLFYHLCLSVGAAVVWLLAVKYAWPLPATHADPEPEHEEVSK